MSSYIYDVKTERFGTVQYAADSIKQARRWAKGALGVTNPDMVHRQQDYVRCDACDCRPCSCGGTR